MSDPPSIADFSAPPIVEVVSGVQFEPLPSFRAPHVGLFWNRVRSAFPICRDAPPLPAVMENIDAQGAHGTLVELGFSAVPQVPRSQLVDKAGRQMIQVQNGRFHHNWQKAHGDDEYQRYKNIRPAFVTRWEEFKKFVGDEQLGDVRPTQYELSYINHVPAGVLWDDARGIGEVLPWFAPRNPVVDHVFEPEFALHSPAPNCSGRLHVTGKVGLRVTDRTKVLALEFVVRGAPKGADDADLVPWMDSAREYIVRSFVELTSERARKQWGEVPVAR